jgi:hypothetical protein
MEMLLSNTALAFSWYTIGRGDRNEVGLRARRAEAVEGGFLSDVGRGLGIGVGFGMLGASVGFGFGGFAGALIVGLLVFGLAAGIGVVVCPIVGAHERATPEQQKENNEVFGRLALGFILLITGAWLVVVPAYIIWAIVGPTVGPLFHRWVAERERINKEGSVIAARVSAAKRTARARANRKACGCVGREVCAKCCGWEQSYNR